MLPPHAALTRLIKGNLIVPGCSQGDLQTGEPRIQGSLLSRHSEHAVLKSPCVIWRYLLSRHVLWNPKQNVRLSWPPDFPSLILTRKAEGTTSGSPLWDSRQSRKHTHRGPSATGSRVLGSVDPHRPMGELRRDAVMSTLFIPHRPSLLHPGSGHQVSTVRLEETNTDGAGKWYLRSFFKRSKVAEVQGGWEE